MKVYIVPKYDSIFDSWEIDKIFTVKERAIAYMKLQNLNETNPMEYDVIEG